LLFYEERPPQNLGFVDPKAAILNLSVAGRDLTIRQSPTLLSSNRAEGTTGAVLWKVSPLFAEWISSPANFMFTHGVISSTSTVLELGCGISGVVALSLAPRITRFIATDQSYVLKVLRQNLDENLAAPKASKTARHKSNAKTFAMPLPKVETIELDWELSSIASLPMLFEGAGVLDAVIACDCIYNEYLVEPFVRACAEVCGLRSVTHGNDPTVCLVAQQLRSPDVFQAWLQVFCKYFRVWRLPDELLIEGLRRKSGYVVHLGILRK
jgi:hypothetical protein